MIFFSIVITSKNEEVNLLNCFRSIRLQTYKEYEILLVDNNSTDKSKQMNFMNLIYENQIKWANGSNINEINENLKEIVKNLGIDSIKFDQCLINESISDKILNGRIDSHQKYNINSTPTIVINEKKLEGGSNFKNIKEKIEKLI